jgi:hypothetical protein
MFIVRPWTLEIFVQSFWQQEGWVRPECRLALCTTDIGKKFLAAARREGVGQVRAHGPMDLPTWLDSF